ncbi:MULTISPECIES: RluA family pseudouridine synthase [Exiguobacterium]|uniref:Pseudouridine synthase n=1 Tax=Exiguobacterium alkaliphilum TaxID=1428684 RepID=A0ABT2L0H3_9BACL|nr:MULTISPECIES: RluA family pseudouridine synthase [Exiguobacterium]KDN56942.1 pseudouridine synthase [Exiguobacterium sp. AB2]MCT4796654.1 RluA family pseudouridine synthase [Exiguobacterium alkaliphilum]QUE85805.1 RluA family pseudouridine synthase [Exiguobacterium alkaliphilum]
MYGLTLRRVVGTSALLRDFLMIDCGISRKMLAQVKQAGLILVNGEPKTVRYTVSVGDEVTVHFPSEQPSETMVRSSRPLTVLYEDEWMLAVDKPAGIATIPSRLHPIDTLANAVLGYYQAIQLDSAIHVINRLDRDTSGVVLFAKYAYVHHRFSELQKQGGLTRTYTALIEGEIEPQTIDAPIGRAEHSIMERVVTPDGQRAVTHVRQTVSHGDVSALTIQLETGRTHQIRVHLRHLGYPLIGDTMYGGNTRLPRHALHSLDATFHHPLTDELLTVTAPIPEDFRQLLI